MNILYIGYWSIDDILTQSCILPHLKVLSEFKSVDYTVFCSIERNRNLKPSRMFFQNFHHVPLNSKNMKLNILTKILDFYLFRKKLLNIINQYKIDYILCQGSLAGSLGYLLWKKTGINFSVETFEPHAKYMKESGTWTKLDPRYIIQKLWEEKQKKHADYLFPVAYNYKKKLIDEGINPERIEVAPIEVDLEKFRFNPESKRKIRSTLNISENTIVGIYIGKFGDIYFEKEAFVLFKKAHDYFQNFYLIIGSPQPEKFINRNLQEIGYPLEKKWVSFIPNDQIPGYLSAADFAFSLIKPSKHKKYCAPVKNGEYWACGLPILIPDGIGDDSDILKRFGLGVVFTGDNYEQYFEKLQSLIKADLKDEIRGLAEKYRNPKQINNIYEKIFNMGRKSTPL